MKLTGNRKHLTRMSFLYSIVFPFFILPLQCPISMTPAAQQALRRTMEIYSQTTRFAYACNTSSKIIEPIQSRCAILRYARLSDDQIRKRLLEICSYENVEYSDDGLNAIVFT